MGMLRQVALTDGVLLSQNSAPEIICCTAHNDTYKPHIEVRRFQYKVICTNHRGEDSTGFLDSTGGTIETGANLPST
jgi:hypothetical protein